MENINEKFMKKIIEVLLTLVIVVSLCACVTSDKEEGPAPGTPVSGFYYAILNEQPEQMERLILLEETRQEVICTFYQGLEDIELAQQVCFMHPISTTPCEVIVVEVANAADAQKVAEIFQKRIDLGANNVAYPANAIGWQTNAFVQQSGSFICMAVLPEGYIVPKDIFALDPAEAQKEPAVVPTATTTPTPEPTATTVPAGSTATPTETTREVPDVKNVITYTGVIELYEQAIKEQWTAEMYSMAGLSSITASYGEESIGFVYLDLDFNDIDELLIIAVEADDKHTAEILDLYTMEKEVLKQLVVAGENNRYNLAQDESGPYELINETSMGEVLGWYYFSYYNDKLHITQAIIYDPVAAPEAPWYMASDDDWDVSNDMAVEDFLAEGIVDSGNKRKMSADKLEFTKFSERCN